MRRAVTLVLFLAAAACSTPPQPKLVAAYGTPDIPPECRQAVYDDPKVREMMIAGAGSPSLRAEDQIRLASLQDAALRSCLRARGQLPPGGVEPIRHHWYTSPF